MLDKVKMEDIPEQFRELAEVIGLEAFINLVRYMGGCIIYVPVEGRIIKAVRNRVIKRAFCGDYKQLAKTYRISEGHIRRILREKD